MDDMGMRSIGILGLQPVTTSKGLMPVDLFTELLYVNSAISNTDSHERTCSPTRHSKDYPESCTLPPFDHQSVDGRQMKITILSLRFSIMSSKSN